MIKELYLDIKEAKPEDYFEDVFNDIVVTRVHLGGEEPLYRLGDITNYFNKRLDRCSRTNDGQVFSREWITARGQNGGTFGEYSDACYVYDWAKDKKRRKLYMRKEDEVYDELVVLLSDYVTHFTDCGKIIRQFPVGPYYLDFYMPSIKLIIEYDEKQHRETRAKEVDRIREENIRDAKGMEGTQIIRIAEGKEIKGYAKVLKFIRLSYE